MKEATLNKKKAVVDDIRQQIEAAQSIVIAEYSGIDVQEITDLSAKFREAGVNYRVYKNTMVRRAFNELGHDEFDELLQGPNAFIFSDEDMVSGPKIAEEFAKDNEEKLIIKAGFIEGKAIDKEKVIALSKLPNKDVLLSMMLRGLQGPISGLAQVSNAILSSLVYGLNAVKEKKEQEEAA